MKFFYFIGTAVVIVQVELCLALNKEHLFDYIQWPSKWEMNHVVTPYVNSYNTINRYVSLKPHLPFYNLYIYRYLWSIDYCILSDATIAKNTYYPTGSDAVFYILSKLKFYANVNFKRVYNYSTCNLKIVFERNAHTYAGVYYPGNNTIIIQMRYNTTPFTIYKTIIHELLHSLGMEHVTTTNDTVMSSHSRNAYIKLLSTKDLAMLLSLRYRYSVRKN